MDPDSNTATVSLSINPVNDAPSADNLSLQTAEDTPVLTVLAGSDIDGDTLTFTVLTQNQYFQL